MVELCEGKVIDILRDDGDAVELLVECRGKQVKAVCYPGLTGPAHPGDTLLLNTTAVRLELGSGGRHFVVANLSNPEKELSPSRGHIMKMRYTPSQCRAACAEEEGSPHRAAIESFESLGGAPVIIGGLHSMVAPVCAALKSARPETNIVYIMTDGACLPLAFSRTTRALKDKNIISATVTCGNAFGGDVETVTKFSALASARAALSADVIVAAMGVGIAGTGTRLGHAGLEVGEWINAAASLGGTPVVIPRLSFADERERHRGVSHHTLTALTVAALARATVALPLLPPAQSDIVKKQLAESGAASRHDIVEADGSAAISALEHSGIRVTTMGRGPEQDPAFFLACGAAAAVAERLLSR
jgi:hypothetical protein